MTFMGCNMHWNRRLCRNPWKTKRGFFMFVFFSLFFFRRSSRTCRFSCWFSDEGPLACSQYITFPRWAMARLGGLLMLIAGAPPWVFWWIWLAVLFWFMIFWFLPLATITSYTAHRWVLLAGSWGTYWMTTEQRRNEHVEVCQRWPLIISDIWHETKCCCYFRFFRNKIVAILHHFNVWLRLKILHLQNW